MNETLQAQNRLFVVSSGETSMSTDIDTEIRRIKDAYKDRDENYSPSWKEHVYHPRHPMGRLFYEHHYNILVNALNALEISLESASILDVGCGSGAWLRMLIELGAKPENLNGIDISESRIASAKRANPAINLIQAKGDGIPFPSNNFDIVMQIVVFSSILDNSLAEILLKEMVRVIKPGGFIFWIDHKTSHSEHLAGYPVDKLREHFSGCTLIYQESVQPGYFRKWHNHPWLCRLLYDFSRNGCDSWFLVFRKER